MKAYTDVNQSKKLADTLPIESADMRYAPFGDTHPWVWDGGLIEKDSISCWSLAALLEVIPKRIKDCAIFRMDIGENDFSIWYDNLDSGMVDETLPDITTNSPVDACYEMIVKLKEMNLL